MPRAPRIEYAGAFYHVMNRGNQLRRVYWDEVDYRQFMDVLEGTCRRTGWRIHSFVLMPNHYHLLIETPRANLVRGMQWLNSTYTLRFNARHRKRGHLLQGRYKALLVEGRDPEYFLTVADYIHLNPLRARVVAAPTSEELWKQFWAYPWSSATAFGRTSGSAPAWLCWEGVFGALGLGTDRPSARCTFRKVVEARWEEKRAEKPWKRVRRGWYLGTERFREHLLERLERMRGPAQRQNWSGTVVEESEEMVAERFYRRGVAALERLGEKWSGEGERRRDWRRQWLAWWIYGRSRVSLRWVARRLGMGHESAVSHGFRRMPRRRVRSRPSWPWRCRPHRARRHRHVSMPSHPPGHA
jgi:REP element-mobilizing transposase RayT